MTELRQLAGFAVNFRLEQAPEEVVRAAKYCVLDSIGSALGAVRYEEIPELCRELRQWCAAPAGRTASVWGQGFSLDVFQALLLNGMMGHALELDDVHTGSKSHVGAVVVETAWTLAEAMGESGRHLLEAVITGYEVMARVGMAMDVVSNRKRGWHGTGIIGTFGAAAAAGHLLGLDEDQMVSALGMAGTQSSGLWAFLEEGATCKKLHPARAAVNGLTAAVLAKGGMTGPERILDAGDGGLYRAVADSFNMETLVKGLGTGYEILKIDKKPYPCCRTTHHAIDGALMLREKADLEQVERILVETYEVGVLQCGSQGYPSSAVEAKFSIPYTVAAALVRGNVSLAEFAPEVIGDPLIKSLANRVQVTADPLFTSRYPDRWGCRLRLIYKDASELAVQVDDMSGSVAKPLTEEQEKRKFEGVAGEGIGAENARKLLGTIMEIEKLDVLKQLL